MKTVRLFAAFFLLGAGCAASQVNPPALDDLQDAGAAPQDLEILAAAGPIELAPAPDLLDDATAVALALRQSPRLRAELARLRAAVAEAEQARSWPNPLLSLTLRVPESGGSIEWDMGLSAALVSVLSRSGRQRAADGRMEAAAATALGVAFEEAEAARAAFVLAVEAESGLHRSERRAEIAAKRRDLAIARQAAGLTGATAAREAIVSAALAGSELELALAECRAARLALAALIGQPQPAAEWSLQAMPDPAIGASPEPWLRRSRELNPEVRRLRALLRAKEAEAELAGAVVRKDLEVGASVEREDSWSAGPALALPLPIFDTGAARRTRARFELEAARHEVAQAVRTAEAEARTAWESCRTLTSQRYQVRNDWLPILVQELERRVALAAGGEAGPEDVLLAEADLIAAEEAELRAFTAFHLAYARLLRIAGGAPESLAD